MIHALLDTNVVLTVRYREETQFSPEKPSRALRL